MKHYSIWRANSLPLLLIEISWKKPQRSLKPVLLDVMLSTTIRYAPLHYFFNRNRLTRTCFHILKGFFNPWNCVEAYNSCKSHGAESSCDQLTYRSSVAIRANGRPLSLSFTSKGCCSASWCCQILFGSHDKPPTHDPNDRAKVSCNTLLMALIWHLGEIEVSLNY